MFLYTFLERYNQNSYRCELTCLIASINPLNLLLSEDDAWTDTEDADLGNCRDVLHCL